ncbi:MAG: type I glutamate--ammonia ligase [Nitrosopumilus sp.]|nr:type I glutamate--ammonia ligase [Nitrosopumilus sp.]MDA7942495.1 type I glutamate--ammonia ligase [Nitrosopumilus sp.]MDA7952626.1 type I glutamate--ammonia ligase [Nitrosopumilus sp.]MDA7958199.1 type I glutamate--ammonia ligase [Nitrosopumilus sp.]MDA7959347.1 type I glutamate--ammonia ligase [Nitrosopumilus sp.]
MDAAQVLQVIKDEGISFIDFWFVDIFGELHNVGMPSYAIDADSFESGLEKLDASSIVGFKSVNSSDMILLPDPGSFKILPGDYDPGSRRNARIFCDLYDGSTDPGSRYNRDSRGIAHKAAERIEAEGFTHSRWGPEIEFFVFDTINVYPSPYAATHSYGGSGYSIESKESPWAKGNVSTAIDIKEGYYPSQPKDTLEGFRKDVCDDLYKSFGILIEAEHHEVATSGQCEINLVNDTMIRMADNVIAVKNLVKVKAKRRNKVATFMPKPIFGDNASAMHTHQSLWKGDKNAMYDADDGVAQISQMCRYYIGGILDHASALCAISNPTTNSYKRLVPGFEAPVNVCWGMGNRSAAIRVPMYNRGHEKSKRIEYRVPDPTANIYLLEAALLLAGLDGIRRKKDPGDPVEDNVYRLDAAKKRELGIGSLPVSLKGALDSLGSDSKFLKDAFTADFLDKYSELKYKEYTAFAQTPTAWEVSMYADA